MTERHVFLRAAEECITKDRAAVYGPAEGAFDSVAGHWNWWLGERLATPLTAYDVAHMMAGFKQARTKYNPSHQDSFVDACGYLAIAGEIGTSREIDA